MSSTVPIEIPREILKEPLIKFYFYEFQHSVFFDK